MSEQEKSTFETEEAINEKAASESLMRVLKKALQTPTATYAAKSNKMSDIQAHDDLAIRLDAVRALQQMGENANSAVPELIKIVEHDETELAAEAALTLSLASVTEEQANQAVPVLITALTRSGKAEKIGVQKNDNLKRTVDSLIKSNAALALSKTNLSQ